MGVLDRIATRTSLAASGDIRRAWTIDQYLRAVAEQSPFGVLYPPAISYGPDGHVTERVENDFCGYIAAGYKANPVIFGLSAKRALVFSEARPAWRDATGGKPGDVLPITDGLEILRRPWPNETFGGLLMRMLIDVDMAGNAYVVRDGNRLRRLRPDWVQIVLTGDPRTDHDVDVLGYLYTPGGPDGGNGRPYLPDEVCHFAPIPDPEASFRGMSWLTPVAREIMADSAATRHKQRFLENGAILGPIVKAPPGLSAEQFGKFIDAFESRHRGANNSYAPVYLAGGSDVTLASADMVRLDFKALQGHAETRMCVAALVPAPIAGVSEGLGGSALNAGNYGAAKRMFGDGTLRPFWRIVFGELASIVDAPTQDADGNPIEVELWYHENDIPFLRDDKQDVANIQQSQASTLNTHITAGWEPDSARDAVQNNDLSLLKHSGQASVQLQPLDGSGGVNNPSPGEGPGDEGGEPDEFDSEYERLLAEMRGEAARSAVGVLESLGLIERAHGPGSRRPYPGQRYRHGWIPVGAAEVVTSSGVRLHVSHDVRPYPGESEPALHWYAQDESGRVVGELWADPDTGQIMQVETPADRRREGIASAVFRVASTQRPIYHSPSRHRTAEGDAWARSVGGEDIPDELAYQPAGYDFDLELEDAFRSSDVGEVDGEDPRTGAFVGPRPDLEEEADALLSEPPRDDAAVERWVVDSVPGLVDHYLADDRLASLRGDRGLYRRVLGRALVDMDLADADPTLPGVLPAAVWNALWGLTFRDVDASRARIPRDGDGDGFVDDGKPTQRPVTPRFLDPEQFAPDVATRLRAGEPAREVAVDLARQAKALHQAAQADRDELRKAAVLRLAQQRADQARRVKAVADLPLKPRPKGPAPLKRLPAKAAPAKANPRTVPPPPLPSRQMTPEEQKLADAFAAGRISKAQVRAIHAVLTGKRPPEGFDPDAMREFAVGMATAGYITELAWSGNRERLESELRRQNTSTLRAAAPFFGLHLPDGGHDAVVAAFLDRALELEGPSRELPSGTELRQSLMSRKVPDLRAALRDAGLPTTGRKAELVDRLEAAYAAARGGTDGTDGADRTGPAGRGTDRGRGGRAAGALAAGRERGPEEPGAGAAGGRRVAKASPAVKRLRADAAQAERAAEQLRRPDTSPPDKPTGRQRSVPFTEADRQAAAARYEARAAQLRAQADRIDGGPAPTKKAALKPKPWSRMTKSEKIDATQKASGIEVGTWITTKDGRSGAVTRFDLMRDVPVAFFRREDGSTSLAVVEDMRPSGKTGPIPERKAPEPVRFGRSARVDFRSDLPLERNGQSGTVVKPPDSRGVTSVRFDDGTTEDVLVGNLTPSSAPDYPAPAKKATPAAADLTGARGLSADPAVRAVQVENRIRQAVGEMPKAPGGWVSISDLRERVGVPRADFDAAVRRLGSDDDWRVVPVDNRRVLTARDREAAVRIGEDDANVVAFTPDGRDAGAPPPLLRLPRGVTSDSPLGVGGATSATKATKAAPAKKATPRKATKATPPTQAAPSAEWAGWSPQDHYRRAEEARAAGNNAEWRRHRSIADTKNRQIVTDGQGAEHLRSLAERDAARRFLRSLLRGQLNQLAEQLGVSTEGSADAVIARILSARFGEG